MKKISLFILIMVFSIALRAQVELPKDVKTGKVTYKEILNSKNDQDKNVVNIKDLVSKIKGIDSVEVIRDNDRIIIKRIGKIPVVYSYKEYLERKGDSWSKFTAGNEEYGYFLFDISIMCDSNKVGYKFTNFIHKHDKGLSDCLGELELEHNRWPDAQLYFWEGYKKQIDSYIRSLIKELEMIVYESDSNNDW